MRLLALLALPVALLVSDEGLAQEATTHATEPSVIRELEQVNASLREIAATLARQADQNRLDLLMKRTQMASGEVERGEAQLRTLENERGALEDQRSRLAEQAETLAAQTEGVPAAERDALTAQIEGEQKQIAQRLRALEVQIAELQNRLAARRDELRDWQAILDRRLSEL